MNIAIIGSWLTGSLAGISLANSGCTVDLYERLSDDELINMAENELLDLEEQFASLNQEKPELFLKTDQIKNMDLRIIGKQDQKTKL